MNPNRLYLLLTLIGIVAPMAIAFNGMRLIGWDMSIALSDLFSFVTSVFGQAIIVWLITSGSALAIFATYESLVRREYYLLWAIPMIIIFSIGAALPFYLYLRSPKRDQ